MLFQPCTLISINFAFLPAFLPGLVFMGGLQFFIAFTEAYGSFYMHGMKCVFGDSVTKHGPFLPVRVWFQKSLRLQLQPPLSQIISTVKCIQEDSQMSLEDFSSTEDFFFFYFELLGKNAGYFSSEGSPKVLYSSLFHSSGFSTPQRRNMLPHCLML